MGYRNIELKELFVVLIPLLIWAALGWFLLPSLITIMDVPDGGVDIGRIAVISYAAGTVCAAFVLIFIVYLITEKKKEPS